MKSIVKLVGVTSCCLVGGVTAANAEPTMLADAELDRVAAGSCAIDLGNCDGFNDMPGVILLPLGFPTILPISPGEPGLPPLVNPGFEPVLPGGLPPSAQFFPLFGPLGGGGCGGIPLSLCDRPYDPALAGLSPPT